MVDTASKHMSFIYDSDQTFSHTMGKGGTDKQNVKQSKAAH